MSLLKSYIAFHTFCAEHKFFLKRMKLPSKTIACTDRGDLIEQPIA